MASEATKIVRAWYAAVNARDPDAIARTLTDDFTWTLWDATTTGRDTSREASALLFQAIPDYHMDMLDMVSDGDKVVTRCTIQGTHRGPLRFRGTKSMETPYAPTGKSFRIPDALAWMETRDGRIAVNRAYWRPEQMLAQLGLLPG